MSNVALKSFKVSTKSRGVQPNGDALTPNNLSVSSGANVVYSSGTTAGAFVDREVFQSITITTSGTQTIDLLAGTFSDGTNSGNLVDKNGVQVTMTTLKHVQVELQDTTGGPTQLHILPTATSAVSFVGGYVGAAGDGSGSQSSEFLWTHPRGYHIVTANKYLAIVNESAAQGTINITLAGCH